jgi:lactoylglutathione lyase
VHLYEAHLPVANTELSKQFYMTAVGLEFAHHDSMRDVVFLWAGADRRSMIGLWGPTTSLGRDFRECHIAFAVSVAELFERAETLRCRGVILRNFFDEETAEPSVIGWMPSAQIYFSDPDGHCVEFIALLDDPPNPTFIGPYSKWNAKGGT